MLQQNAVQTAIQARIVNPAFFDLQQIVQRRGRIPALFDGGVPGAENWWIRTRACETRWSVLVEPTSRGDPMSALRWTCKRLKHLAGELTRQGHAISHVSVSVLLKEMGYSLQGNRKTLEGSGHPDRNAQFEYINNRTQSALDASQPVISVDTKKKELVGQYKNGGSDWRPQGNPEQVKVHDFVDKELGRANPYGVYDVANNNAWVSVGTDHDTASFAVATIRRWWFAMGQSAYPAARELMIMGRRRRKQRLKGSSLEAGTAATCRRTGPDNPREPLPARHQQVEQNRTPPVFVHQHELAGSPIGKP